MKKLRFFDSLKFVRAIFVAVACIFAFAPAHAAILPAGYTELEYLESTDIPSQAYINTGLNFNSDYMYEITYAKGGGQNVIMGARKNASYSAVGNFSVTYYNVDTYVYSSTQNASTGVGLLDTVFGTKHTIKYQQSTSTLLFDNTNKWEADWVTQTSIPYNMYLFAFNSVGTAGGSRTGYVRIYSYSVKNANGAFVQNFIPARHDSDGVLGMYDLADANPATAFHTNAGTGTFIAGEWQIKIATTRYNEEQFEPVQNQLSDAMDAVDDVVTRTMSQAQAIDTIATTKQTRPDEGCTAKYCLLVEDEDGTPHWYPIAGANGVAHALPAGYTELQYIESTGTQYIDTGYTPNSNTKLVLDVLVPTLTTSACTFAGAMNDAWRPGFGVYGGNTTYKMASVYDNSDVTGNPEYASNTRYTIELNGRVYTVTNDGAVVFRYTHPASSSFVAPATLNLFMIDINPDRYGKFRLYSAKIYNNNTLVRDFIPAKNSSGVVGLYDLADANPATAFYTNAGTGDFVAGPDM